MKTAVVFVFVLLVGMLFVTPVAAARSVSPACPIPIGPSLATVSPRCGGGGCTPTLVTFTFYVHGSAQIVFDFMHYTNGQSDTYPVGCGESYPTSVWFLSSGTTFWQWATTTNGHFGSPNTNYTTYYVGSTGGMIDAILNDTNPGLAVSQQYSQPGGYYLTGLPTSNLGVEGYFTVPTLTYRSSIVDNQLAFVVSLGGFTAPNGQEDWQLWFLMNVSSSGIRYSVAFVLWNFQPLLGPYFEDIPGTISPGDTIRMGITLNSGCNPTYPSWQAAEMFVVDTNPNSGATWSDGWCNVQVPVTTLWWGAEDPPSCPIGSQTPPVCHILPKFTSFSVSQLEVFLNQWSNAPTGADLHMDGDDFANMNCLAILPQNLAPSATIGGTSFTVSWSSYCSG